jgi:transposase
VVERLTTEEINRHLLEQIKEQSETIKGLNETVDGLHKTIDELNQTIKELLEKLGKNSRNSSKPPSSDGLKKPEPKSLRKASGKKPGGQKGHNGSHFNITSEPDEIILHTPGVCLGCPRHDMCVSHACVGETRHVVDAVVETRVVAHQSLVMQCPMSGLKHKGEFPKNVTSTMQYGDNLQALVVALNTIGAVSINRTHEILSSVFSIPLSTGTISNMVHRCAVGLSSTVEKIREKMVNSALAHFDETGTRVDGKTIWVHNASNCEYTYLTVHAKRGKDGTDAGGVFPFFSGIAVHDCWIPYWKYENVIHALCNAHLLRELISVEENHPEQTWATQFKKLLLTMKSEKERAIELGKERV